MVESHVISQINTQNIYSEVSSGLPSERLGLIFPLDQIRVISGRETART